MELLVTDKVRLHSQKQDTFLKTHINLLDGIGEKINYYAGFLLATQCKLYIYYTI